MVCIILALCWTTKLRSEDSDTSRAQVVSVPVVDARGHVVPILTRVCRPAGDSPGRLVVINHGTPPKGADRGAVQLGRCDHEAAQWFLTRGYVVAFPLRRGYGDSGGDYAEGDANCAQADFVREGIETARDIDAAVNYVTSLPGVLPNQVVVIGQSAGGWGTIAYDAVRHPKVSAFVVMAGGRGGHVDNQPNRNCRPDLLAEAARQFGKTASTSMLWIYTQNDSYFGPPIARALWQAFTRGGTHADLKQLEAFGDDGHRLFFGRGGSAIWGPLIESYLKEQSTPSA